MVSSNRVVCDHLAAPLSIDGIPAQFTLNGKFLGIVLVSKLAFREYIGVICKKLSTIIGIFYTVKELLPRKLL